ncbi:hypothetical protein PR048_025841 [Dryococelus australis]|uniref:Uncharacterized protein n=1 Tax=Dryococelus australis TaxID=614101 RepID=A0ABQ9GJQ7_9NEOP|nr:hypothetical protein PR048_025841 [Dryococelus australis]
MLKRLQRGNTSQFVDFSASALLNDVLGKVERQLQLPKIKQLCLGRWLVSDEQPGGAGGVPQGTAQGQTQLSGQAASPSRRTPPSLSVVIVVVVTVDREPDVLLSDRRLSEEDVVVVAPLLGASWRVLGLRLNYDPLTLDHVQLSSRGKHADAKLVYIFKLERGVEKFPAVRINEVLRADEGEVRRVWSGAEMQGRGSGRYPRRGRRPVASSGTIPICENPGATTLGIEPGSSRREVRILSTTPTQQDVVNSVCENQGCCVILNAFLKILNLALTPFWELYGAQRVTEWACSVPGGTMHAQVVVTTADGHYRQVGNSALGDGKTHHRHAAEALILHPSPTNSATFQRAYGFVYCGSLFQLTDL